MTVLIILHKLQKTTVNVVEEERKAGMFLSGRKVQKLGERVCLA